MKSLTVFLHEVLAEAGTICGISTERDSKTISLRVEKEGFSFLTITLPTFGKDLEVGLSRGYVGSDLWTGFGRTGSQCLPSFLKGFTSRIFDTNTGVLLNEPDKQAIACLRQVSYLLSKIEKDCSPLRTKRAIDAYIECEKELVPLSDAWKAELDLNSVFRTGGEIPVVKIGHKDATSILDRSLDQSYLESDVRAFLGLARFFGAMYGTKSATLWLLSPLHQLMEPVPLPTGFTETRSFIRISGPIGLKTATFLLGGTLSADGGIMTLTMSSSSNLEPRDL